MVTCFHRLPLTISLGTQRYQGTNERSPKNCLAPKRATKTRLFLSWTSSKTCVFLSLVASMETERGKKKSPPCERKTDVAQPPRTTPHPKTASPEEPKGELSSYLNEVHSHQETQFHYVCKSRPPCYLSHSSQLRPEHLATRQPNEKFQMLLKMETPKTVQQRRQGFEELSFYRHCPFRLMKAFQKGKP